jgi:hypothetical protein
MTLKNWLKISGNQIYFCRGRVERKKKQGAENFSAPCPMLGQDGVGPDTIFSGF